MTDEPTETGIVTAAVTLPATPATAPLPEDFSVPAAVALARDLAINLYDRPIILKKHSITEAQCRTLEANDYFKKLQEQLSLEWNSPKSAQERLALHTAIGLETVLPDAISRIKVKNEPLAGIAQMVKVLADIAGANAAAKQNKGPAGEKFTITINLGADKEVYEKSRPTVVIDQEEPPVAPEVQPVAQGFGSLLTLLPEPEKA